MHTPDAKAEVDGSRTDGPGRVSTEKSSRAKGAVGCRRPCELLGHANAVLWEVNLENLRLSFVNQQESILPESLFVAELSGPEFVAQHAHPDDIDQIREVGRRLLGGESELTLEHRVLNMGDAVRWVRSFVRVRRPTSHHGARMIGLSVDITEYKQTEAALRSSLLELKAAEAARIACMETQAALAQREEEVRARDEFISIASHELKSPVAALVLMLEMTSREVKRLQSITSIGDRLPGHLDRLSRQAYRISQLINSLLDTTRLRVGHLELRLETTDLVDVVREVTAQLEEDARASGCTVTFEAPGTLIGRWDRLRLEQVVRNLLGNALKFGSGRPVEVSLEGDATNAVLKVRDHGIGIPAEETSRLFQPYERTQSARGYKGLGLGLWISNEIVALHGGSIQLNSAVDAGATFTVTLPRRYQRGDGPA